MIVAYLPAFVRDLKRLKGTRDYERIRRLAFEEAPAWQGIEELPQVKKLAGQTGAYRLRIGDYRIGILLGWGETDLGPGVASEGDLPLLSLTRPGAKQEPSHRRSALWLKW